jgi:hypothetical protein
MRFLDMESGIKAVSFQILQKKTNRRGMINEKRLATAVVAM